MAKAYDDLFDRVVDFDNLHSAWRKAAKGKRGRAPAAGFELNLADELIRLQDELRQGDWRPGRFQTFRILDPKPRRVSAAPFRDRVVHHALCNVTQPLFENTFIGDSYANRHGKGTHAALDRAQQLMRNHCYVLQCDVRQFFPSIDHAILERILFRKIADIRVQNLVGHIVASGAGIHDGDYVMDYFPGDDLLAILRPRGLPIGNLTSQLWANVYLNELDQFVKRQLRCAGYVRYVDDFLLFGDDKARLWDFKTAIRQRLADLRLTLHEGSSTVYPVGNGIPFLGFRLFASHRLLRRRNGVNFQRRLRRGYAAYARGELDKPALDARVQGWVAHASHADTFGLRRAIFAAPLPARR